MLTITPTQASYRIGDTVTVADPANDLFANSGDSVHLLMFGGDYSEVLATTTADENGIATFADVVIPVFPTGTPRFFVMRHAVSMGEVAPEEKHVLPVHEIPMHTVLRIDQRGQTFGPLFIVHGLLRMIRSQRPHEGWDKQH